MVIPDTLGKRIFDVSVSLVIAGPAIIVCFFCAIAVLLDDGRPIFFRQIRIGKDNKNFLLLKIRTMSIGTENAASHEVSVSQITSVGRVLRKLKLDELPQIYNIFTGAMSWVGPRPCLPSQSTLIIERERYGVNRSKPGITGTGQLSGLDMSTPVELARADATYLVEWSIRRDLAILFRTFTGRGSGDAVKG